MKWYQLVSQEDVEKIGNPYGQEEHEVFRIDIRPPSSIPITEMGVIAQMFIAPFVLVSEQSSIQLPVQTPKFETIPPYPRFFACFRISQEATPCNVGDRRSSRFD